MTSTPWGTDADAEHHELALAENRHHVCHWHVADINTVDRMDHIANGDLARERRRTPFGVERWPMPVGPNLIPRVPGLMPVCLFTVTDLTADI